ncbi:MAG: sigma-54-dependent Fis family transcriptional regulator [Alphaproteobacteria bacterium CG_4_10_14_0_8_um_filter_53_9]|nr:MAG: sigma-54-dependent Fis family transcriptional regulator [Alphaproteobacteria bacterium CG_4_10_14_0_8_um_filter_53_9]
MSKLLCLSPSPCPQLAGVVKAAGYTLTESPDLSTLITLAAGGATAIFSNPTNLPAILSALKENQLTLPVIVIGEASPAVATKSIRLGAREYLTTPVESALIVPLLAKIGPQQNKTDVIAAAPLTLKLIEDAKQYAASPATVLIRGESGCGKEVFAGLIHRHSPRKDKPFVAVNCAAIPVNLLESELFGHEKGAFSGAVAKRLGKFQQADGGTLLLDEISEMDLSLQAKLLRAIQEKVIDPVGSDKPVTVDIRLIATTNRQLEEFVAEGKFREDLYFRLNVVSLELAPLRERKEDVLPLTGYFADKYAKQNKVPTPTFSKGAQEKLEGCYWKGNVRELENTIHRAILLGHGKTELTEADIILSPMSLQHMKPEESNVNAATAPGGLNPAATLAAAAAQAYATGKTGFVPKRLGEVEKETLLATLTYTQQNQQYAADLLGITLPLLKEKLTAHGLL